MDGNFAAEKLEVVVSAVTKQLEISETVVGPKIDNIEILLGKQQEQINILTAAIVLMLGFVVVLGASVMVNWLRVGSRKSIGNMLGSQEV